MANRAGDDQAPSAFRRGLRPHQIDMAYAKRLREFEKGNDCWISASGLQATDILLAESGSRSQLLLRQACLLTKAGKVAADQFAHIHAAQNRRFRIASLSTIICIRAYDQPYEPAARPNLADRRTNIQVA